MPATAWRCVICGYVHRGNAAPDPCPVCGAPASEFEAFAEAPPPATRPTRPMRWRCVVCGYLHEGAEPPDVCPLCGVDRDRFAAADLPGDAGIVADAPHRVVVIGGGIAGVTAAEAARKAAPNAEITLVSAEPELPYYRINLTRFLAGDLDEAALTMHPAAWYDTQGVRLVRGMEVAGLGLADYALALSDGARLPFDKLVLAGGAHAFRPPLAGAELSGVHTLRTLRDAQAILADVKSGARALCIGGGILGLETAGALASRGAAVTLLEGFSHLMPRQLSQRGAEHMADFVGRLGIRLHTHARTKEIQGRGGRVHGVLLDDGRRLEADFVVIAIGVRSNTHLARKAGVTVENGIIVDARLNTSHPDVWAAGDAAEHNGVLYGAWAAAQFQGAIAGANAAGGRIEFGGIPRAHTLKVLGLGLFSIGRFEPADAGDAVLEDESEGRYRRLLVRDGALVGAILLGDTSLAVPLTRTIERGTRVEGWADPGVRVQDLLDRLRL